jgi:hypothetical protein
MCSLDTVREAVFGPADRRYHASLRKDVVVLVGVMDVVYSAVQYQSRLTPTISIQLQSGQQREAVLQVPDSCKRAAFITGGGVLPEAAA